MSFRRRLSLFLVVTLVLAQLATAALVYGFGRNRLIEQGKAELATSAGLFVRQLDELGRQIAGGVQVLALDFALRQAVAQHDQDTMLSTLRNHGKRIGAARMLLIGLDGVIGVDTLRPDRSGEKFWFPTMLDAATDDGRAASVVSVDGQVYWLVLVPVLAPAPIAVIAAAIPLDDRLIRKLQSLGSLPSAISIVTDHGNDTWVSVARSEAAGDLISQLPLPSQILAREPTTVMADGEDKLMLAAPLDTPPGSPRVVTVLAYSVTEALEPYQPLVYLFAGVLAGATCLALIGWMLIARRESQPIEALAAATRRIEAGDYTPPTRLRRTDELGQLSAALGTMAVAIGEREANIRLAASEAERAAVLEATTRTLARLGEAGQELTAGLDRDLVFTRLQRHVADLLHAETLLIYLFGTEDLGLAYGIDRGSRLPPSRLPIEMPAADLITGGKLMIAAAAPLITEISPGGSFLQAELIAGDRLLGLVAVRAEREVTFGERERLILRTLAAYTAVALSNATAYRELDTTLAQLRVTMAERERLQRLQDNDLRFARELQLGTLPASTAFSGEHFSVAIEARMEALKEVGGDFFDFARLDENRVFFAVGDASGKGVPAAMFMSMARTSLRTGIRQSTGPGAILTEVNKFLTLNNPAMMFVTIVVGVVDLATGVLTYSSAGHPYAIRTGADGAVVTLEEGRGMAVGIDDSSNYPEATYQLRTGDTLVMFSDGISEAENGENVQYGEERLAMLVGRLAEGGIDDLVAGVFADVQHFAGGYPASDDITVMALRLSSVEPGLKP